MRLALATVALWLLAATASAQVIVNPSRVAWQADDHAITTRYEVGWFLAGATTPVQVASVPVAAVSAAQDEYSAALPRPVLGQFVARLRACGAAVGGSEVCSEWSDPSGPFVNNPARPRGLSVR